MARWRRAFSAPAAAAVIPLVCTPTKTVALSGVTRASPVAVVDTTETGAAAAVCATDWRHNALINVAHTVKTTVARTCRSWVQRVLSQATPAQALCSPVNRQLLLIGRELPSAQNSPIRSRPSRPHAADVS